MEAWKRYSVAVDHYESEHFETAFKIFEKLAEHGHLESMSMLATMYGAGQFVSKNIAASIEWDTKAIAGGSKTSIANLATTYLQNNEKELAEKWFLQAIATGDGDSMLDLAKMKLEDENSITEVKKLLNDALESSSITENSRDEAASILRNLNTK
jgi:TPR repeat protein